MSAEIEAKLSHLNKALEDHQNFKDFKTDPVSFTKRHGLQIDDELGNKIKSALANANSLAELKTKNVSGTKHAFVAAIVSGALAVSTSKIAAAII